MSSVVDAAVLEALESTVGAEFLSELINTFLSEAPGILIELKEASATGDADAMRRAAHSLKSNASTFGAFGLAESARRIEMDGLGATPEETIAALQSSLDEACEALKEQLDD